MGIAASSVCEYPAMRVAQYSHTLLEPASPSARSHQNPHPEKDSPSSSAKVGRCPQNPRHQIDES